MSIGEGSEENDNQLMEVFNVELETECKKFKSNKCPIQIGKGTEYFKFGGLDKFTHAKIKKIDYSILLVPTLFSFIPFFIVAYLLIVVILTKDKACIILLCIHYLPAFILQLATFPRPQIFDSREDFEIYLRKILNCGVKILVKNGKDIVPFPGEYTADIIGQIDIPKNINFILIKKMDIFINSNLKKFKEKTKNLYKDPKFHLIYKYNNEKFNFEERLFMVNSNKEYSNVDFFDAILCLLLLHGFRTLYYMYSSFYKYIEITPSKLVTDVQSFNSTTKINFQGNIFKPNNNCIRIDINTDKVEQLEKEFQKKKDKEEHRKQQIKKEKDNTFTLSDFSISKLFDLEIIRVYDDVYALIDLPGYNRKKIHIGYYDESIQEETLKDDTYEKVYIPRGLNKEVRIVIKPYYLDFFFGNEYRQYERR